MRDIDTALLRTFVVLAETHSFTKTAKKVHRTQSAVSMQIAKLEELLECTLFERDKRNVSLTTEGERLRGHAQQLIEFSDNLIGQFRTPDIEGEIYFGSPEDFATFYLPEILAEFVKTHPRVRLHVNCDLTLSLIESFNRKQYDVVIIKQEPNKIHKDSIPLWKERLVWVSGMASDRDLSFKRTANKYLKQYNYIPLILSPAPCVYRQRIIDAADKSKLPWEVVYTSPSFSGVIAAVKAGLGLTVLPRKMVPEDLFPLEAERGWPKLKDAEMCLLAQPNISAAGNTFVEYIQQRISFNISS